MQLLGRCSNNGKPLTPEVRLNERKSTKYCCIASFTFDDSTGELSFNNEHKVECKPMTMIEILNNPYHFKMTISPKKQINLKKNGSKTNLI